MHILTLGTAGKYLLEAAKETDCTLQAYEPLDLYLYISENVSGYDRIYDGNPELEKPQRLKIKDYDFIIPRLSGQLEHKTVVLEHLNNNLGIYSPQKGEPLRTASNKIQTTLRLSQAGLKTPKTVWSKAPAHVQYIIEDLMDGLPVVVKSVYGSQGSGVSILETKLSANTTLESFYKHEINVKLQRYIDGNFTDIRAIVVGDEVVTAMERTANKGDFRANLSKSGSGRKLVLSKEDQQLCIDASKAVGLEYSGVDLMKDKEGISYVIEVNGNPGTKIIDITGINFFKNLIEYCIKEKKRGATTKEGYGAYRTDTFTDDDGKIYVAHVMGDVTHLANHPQVASLHTNFYEKLNQVNKKTYARANR
ncbi:ATP-grasp domain-containing protein [Spirosoma endbachense]|uniref:RimK family alpha-L-glutamate ligase n=1 Tax=Spirosoma endbachense TaxID=2666025 RepID=A0A6P1W107_9BACT|nr:RimK family alpha-L-glutamate ligase [Spirosoma endbachense]QHV98278.1 RimK family alpha-L-glutamate ligase [Spirosoma endbachense]